MITIKSLGDMMNLAGNNPKKFRPYRKKPVIINAMQIDEEFEVHTKKGIMRAKPGDYLIEGVEGELYPCDRDIFQKTYDPLRTGEERR